MSLFRSASEANAVGGPLVRLFVTALGRRPDEPALRRLVDHRRNGAALAQVAALLCDDPEFQERHGPSGPPDEHYLRALFWAIDGEDPDSRDAVLLQPPATRASVLLAASQSHRAHRAVSLADNLFPNGLPPEDDLAYQFWLERGPALSAEDGLALARHAARLPAALISVIVTVAPARADLLKETIQSLSAQIWPQWECLLLCPADLPPHVRAAATALAGRVPAVRLVAMPQADAQCGAAEGATLALEQAGGVLACWIESGDRLAPTALYEAAAILAARPGLRLIYTDEDCINGDGTRFHPTLKPGWSPDLALTGDAFGQLVLFDRAAAVRAGGFPAEAGPHARYALCLRLAHDAPAGSVRHVPAIVFHRGRLWGQASRAPRAKALPGTALGQVVSGHLAQHHSALALEERMQGPHAWPNLVASLPQPPPRVSVIIPTRDRAALLERCLTGLLTETDYPAIEVLVVDNDSKEPETLALLQRAQHDTRVRVLPHPGVFNWSALNNAAAAVATGEVLLLLNNDIEVQEPGWLGKLVAHVMRPDVGVVGARLLFPDGTLQHGGILLGPKGQAVHAMTYAPEGEGGYLGQVALPRDLSAVTGACLAVRRAVFEAVGGLEAETLRVGWSDVDFCLRVREAGLRVLWLPDVVLTHREMATRGRDTTQAQQVRHETERAALRRRWPAETDRDPFLNPSLDATATGLVLTQSPRRVPPWYLDERDHHEGHHPEGTDA